MDIVVVAITRPAQRVLLGVGLVISVLVAAACGTGPAVSERPPEIAATFPRPGDQVIAQAEVGADVPQGWSFELFIDGVAIPYDELDAIEELGIYKFLPRPGKVIERLPQGDRTARVVIVPPLGGTPVSYEWTFRVLA